jgi:hypothetical protein
MNTGCRYEHWSRKKHALVKCGRKCEERETLCAFHLEWQKDCATVQTRGKGAHPADWNWTRKARAAYGCIGSAILRLLPSDAGANYICGRRIERAKT